MTQPARRTFLPGHVVVIIYSITKERSNFYTEFGLLFMLQGLALDSNTLSLTKQQLPLSG